MFEVYRDAQNLWRWRLKGKNGKIVADGGEGYAKRSGMLKALERTKELAATAGIIEVVELPGMKVDQVATPALSPADGD